MKESQQRVAASAFALPEQGRRSAASPEVSLSVSQFLPAAARAAARQGEVTVSLEVTVCGRAVEKGGGGGRRAEEGERLGLVQQRG